MKKQGCYIIGIDKAYGSDLSCVVKIRRGTKNGKSFYELKRIKYGDGR
jgi:hypothetical protein